VYIKDDNQERVVPSSLSVATVSFNNLTVSIDTDGGCTIETRGEWKGDMRDLHVILDTAIEQLGKDDEQDK